MFDWISEFSAEALPAIGTGLAWIVTVSLLILGVVGTLIPILPGHLILFFAALAHWLMLGEKSGVEWWTFTILAVLLIISQVLEFMSGAMGTRWFGGTRWGATGALLGGIVGLFFMPFGLFLGPLIGAMLCEFIFAKKEVKPATISGVGSLVGTVAGLGIKIIIGAVMTIWLVVDIIWIG